MLQPAGLQGLTDGGVSVCAGPQTIPAVPAGGPWGTVVSCDCGPRLPRVAAVTAEGLVQA